MSEKKEEEHDGVTKSENEDGERRSRSIPSTIWFIISMTGWSSSSADKYETFFADRMERLGKKRVQERERKTYWRRSRAQ